MKTAFLVFCTISFIFSGLNGQSLQSIEVREPYLSKISALASSISQRNKSEMQEAKLFFKKAHRDFLKKYNAYARVEDIFEKGNYDCLSGTYFLSLGLTKLGIKHRIIETNYHIFLIAETKQGEVLMESTDRYEGFVSSKRKIDQKTSEYRQNNLGGTSRQLYLSNFKIYHEIHQQQLSGLLYFNQAIELFHENKLEACCENLEMAWKIYDNPRIEEFAPILIHSILQSKLDQQKKESLTLLLRSHLQQVSKTFFAIR